MRTRHAKWVLGHSSVSLAEPSVCTLHPAPRDARQLLQSVAEAETQEQCWPGGC